MYFSTTYKVVDHRRVFSLSLLASSLPPSTFDSHQTSKNINCIRMLAYKSLITLVAVQAVSAHFGLSYPEWRGDTLNEENEDLGYNQWLYPCM